MRPSVLDALVKAKRPKKAAKKSEPAPNLGELRRAASHIVTHPDILSLFAEQFSKVIAGESVNGKLLYLVATPVRQDHARRNQGHQCGRQIGNP
jgi:hypothetical protein